MLTLALAAITMLFVGLTFAYTFGRKLSDNWESFSLPKLFWLSTILLLGCSYGLQRARDAHNQDEARLLRQNLWLVFGLGLAFVVSQIVAWRQLAASGVGLVSSPASGYLYVISWLHAAHVVVGLLALSWMLRKTIRQTKEPVGALLYFSDPAPKHRLRLLSTYWHVVDGLWVYLFLFFLFFHS
jgi:cytochrome c oxidase subunit 3